MIRRAAPLLLSQAGWIVVATLAGRGRGALAAAAGAAVAIVIALLAERRARTAVFAAGAALLGPLADVPLVHAGLLTPREPLLPGGLMPLWWWGLWAMFAAALPASFGWLRGRPLLAGLIGAGGGPAAYAAGARLEAIGMHPRLWPSLVAIGAVWAVLMPLAVAAASRVVPPSEPHR